MLASMSGLERRRRRDWRGDGVAAGGGGGGVHEAAVVRCSVQIGDVLLGKDEGELGMHG